MKKNAHPHAFRRCRSRLFARPSKPPPPPLPATTRGQPPAHLWSCVHLRGRPPPFLRPSPLITHTLRASRGPAFRRRHFEGMGERVPTERGWPSQAMSSPPPFHRSVPFLIPCANQLQFDSWSRCSLVADSVSNQGSWYYLFVC
jgi:hypothetical protein